MSQLYSVTGLTKQGFHQWLGRELKKREEQQQLLPILRQMREDHPRLSCRKMYCMLTPKTMGRDQFERLCYAHGYKVRTVKKFTRTTDSSGVNRFPNLLLSTEKITGINQVWVSDITYFWIKDQVFYLTFIMDLYSRRLVGWSASQTLRTEDTTLPALSMALANRKIHHYSNLILCLPKYVDHFLTKKVVNYGKKRTVYPYHSPTVQSAFQRRVQAAKSSGA